MTTFTPPTDVVYITPVEGGGVYDSVTGLYRYVSGEVAFGGGISALYLRYVSDLYHAGGFRAQVELFDPSDSTWTIVGRTDAELTEQTANVSQWFQADDYYGINWYQFGSPPTKLRIVVTSAEDSAGGLFAVRTIMASIGGAAADTYPNDGLETADFLLGPANVDINYAASGGSGGGGGASIELQVSGPADYSRETVVDADLIDSGSGDVSAVTISSSTLILDGSFPLPVTLPVDLSELLEITDGPHTGTLAVVDENGDEYSSTFTWMASDPSPSYELGEGPRTTTDWSTGEFIGPDGTSVYIVTDPDSGEQWLPSAENWEVENQFVGAYPTIRGGQLAVSYQIEWPPSAASTSYTGEDDAANNYLAPPSLFPWYQIEAATDNDGDDWDGEFPELIPSEAPDPDEDTADPDQEPPPTAPNNTFSVPGDGSTLMSV